MTELPLKRPRVTEDILSHVSTLSSHDLKDTSKDKILKISTQIERLEAENYKLLKQIEWSNRTHELTNRENIRQISALINEKNDIKARTIHHKTRADEASKTLQIMKAKHIEVTNELREKNVEDSKNIVALQTELIAQQAQNGQHAKQMRHLQESHQLEIAQLKKTIELLTQANSDQLKTIEKVSQRELELANKLSALESESTSSSTNAEADIELYNNLSDQYQRVCKRSEKLESENSKLASELKHYKGISQNVEYLREECNSLKQQLCTLDEVSKAKFLLEVENANLVAERNAWARYLDSKPEYNQQTPASIIHNLTKQADDSKYLSREVQQLQTELQNQYKLIGLLEDHVDELKSVALEKDRLKALSEADHMLFNKREEILKKHITILQGQLQLYDHEEKNNMESSYDQNKTLRIAQLEIFLREVENKLKTQAQEITKSINAGVTSTTVSHGPYEQLTTGKKIIDFLQQMSKQKDQYIQELTSAKSKAQEYVQQSTDSIPLQQQQEHRILTLLDNPASTVQAIRKDQLTRLQKENADLLKRLVNNEDATVDTVTMPSISYTHMQKQITSLEKRIVRLHTIWENKIKETSKQIRDLWGYNVTFRADGFVHLVSIFVDSNELSFLVKDEDDECILRMVGTNKKKYMDLLVDIYQTYIINERHVPAFLNAAYLELYVQSKGVSGSEVEDEEEEGDTSMLYEDEQQDSMAYEENDDEEDLESSTVHQDNDCSIVYQDDAEESEDLIAYEEEEGELANESDDIEQAVSISLGDEEEEGYNLAEDEYPDDEEEGEDNETTNYEATEILLLDSDDD